MATSPLAIRVAWSGLTTATTAYTAGDTLGVIKTFANAAQLTGGTGVIRSVTVVDKSDIVGSVTLFIYRSTVTLAADNAVWSVSDADQDALVTKLYLPFTDDGVNHTATVHPYCGYDCAGVDLFIGMRTDAAHTFFGAATDLQVTLWTLRD